MYLIPFAILQGSSANSRGTAAMSATIIERQETSVTIQVTIALSRSMLDTEEAIQQALNQAGVLASAEALKQFDTDGSPLLLGSTRFTSKGQEPKTYQTPYGPATVARHVYQTGEGGSTFCPLERDARIILTSTPRFAMLVSHKYGEGPADRVVRDLSANHCRPVAASFVQDTAAAVAAVVQIKEESWHYATPALPGPIGTIGVGVDGTCMLVVDDGRRQAMAGGISLYDRRGERRHTIYVAATPQYGKETFYTRMGREIEHVRKLYPSARLTAVADGSEDNWTFTRQYTDDECIDFYHASAYLGWVARAVHPRSPMAREEWIEDRRHKLKHEKGYARELLAQMRGVALEGLSGTVGGEGWKARTKY